MEREREAEKPQALFRATAPNAERRNGDVGDLAASVSRDCEATGEKTELDGPSPG